MSKKGGKAPLLPEAIAIAHHSAGRRSVSRCIKLTLFALAFLTLYHLDLQLLPRRIRKHSPHKGWGPFPGKNDPFRFLPCTNATLRPGVDEARPVEAWMRSYDAEPSHWSWGANSTGLYLCGWLDVPLDYTNASDPRIVRLAVTKYQHSPRGASQRTLVVEPGGPGTSGTNLVFRKAEHFSSAYTNSTFDVLGWDPRGVNASQPSIACFPYDADRDRYALFASRFYREVEDAPRRAMLMADAMNEAVLGACARKYRDVVRMLSTSFVARDLDRLREALGGRVLDGYFVLPAPSSHQSASPP